MFWMETYFRSWRIDRRTNPKKHKNIGKIFHPKPKQSTRFAKTHTNLWKLIHSSLKLMQTFPNSYTLRSNCPKLFHNYWNISLRFCPLCISAKVENRFLAKNIHCMSTACFLLCTPHLHQTVFRRNSPYAYPKVLPASFEVVL